MSSFDPGDDNFLNLDEHIKQLMAEVRSSISVVDSWVGEEGRPYVTLGRQIANRWLERSDFLVSDKQAPNDQPTLILKEDKIADWLAPGSEVLLTDTGLAVAVRQFTEQIDRQFFEGVTADEGTWATASDEDGSPSLTLDDIAEVIREFRQRAIEHPHLQEIWFVDKPVDRHRFIGEFPVRTPEEDGPSEKPFIWEWLHGISVYAWDSRAELDECKAQEDWASFFERIWRVPHAAMQPGIWLKLSNGRFQQVADVVDLIAAFKASDSADNSG